MNIRALSLRFGGIAAKGLLSVICAFVLFMIIPLAQNFSRSEEPQKEAPAEIETIVLQQDQRQKTHPEETEMEPDIDQIETSMDRPSQQPAMDFSPDLGVSGEGAAVGGSQSLSTVVMEEGEADSPPSALQKEPISYPQAARRRGIEGKVVVTFIVDRRGNVGNIEFEELPHTIFEEPVRETIRNWQFQPGIYEGTAVAVRVRQTINFSLE
ncbi:MAG: TonB family protein [Fibrobacterota bacterium]